MAEEHNYFALLGDLDGDNMPNVIDGVKQEDDKKKSSRAEKVQTEKKEDKKMAQQIPTDMRAKRLVLPSHVRRSFIVFDKKKEREKVEAEARRKAKEEAKANDSVESNGGQPGGSDPSVPADDESGEQPLTGNFASSDNSIGGQSTTLNKYRGGRGGGNGYHRKNEGHYNYQRNNRVANVYQQNNGYSEENCTSANGYQPRNSGQTQGSYKGSNGNQRYNRKYNGVSIGDQFNKGGYPRGNVANDGWHYVRRRHCDDRRGTYQENSTHEQDVINYESLEESKFSQKDSEKSVNGDNDVIISNENKQLAGQQAMHLPMTTEGQEDSQSEKKSGEGMDGAKSRKKSKKKNNKKKDQDNFEKKNEKKEKDMRNLMTLQECEKKLEDGKNLEAFKRPDQRKVEDKDFESMQIVGKKKEGIQLDKVKKKDNKKEEKVRKAVSINEFLKPVKDMWQRRYGYRPYWRRDTERDDADSKGNGERHDSTREDGRMRRGQGDGDRADGKGYGERPSGRRNEGRTASEGPVPSSPPPLPPSFDFDQHQFPALRGNGKA